MFLKKKKKPKVFKIPQKEIKVKVLGHIDLDTINAKTKPKKIIPENKITKAIKNLKQAEESLNRNYNGIVNLLEFHQLCELRDSLNKYITLSQRVEKLKENENERYRSNKERTTSFW